MRIKKAHRRFYKYRKLGNYPYIPVTGYWRLDDYAGACCPKCGKLIEFHWYGIPHEKPPERCPECKTKLDWGEHYDWDGSHVY